MNPAELYKDEANIAQGDDGHWYYTPDKFSLKLVFLIASLFIILLGGVLGWDPAVRYLLGDQATARITRIVREEPDKEPEVIRYRKEIPEGDHLTRFTYTIAVDQADGSSKEMTLAVGSRRNAYANVNDDVEVIYFPGENHAYALFEHRTWSFSVGLCSLPAPSPLCSPSASPSTSIPRPPSPPSPQAARRLEHASIRHPFQRMSATLNAHRAVSGDPFRAAARISKTRAEPTCASDPNPT
jgi:hypothetical protein